VSSDLGVNDLDFRSRIWCHIRKEADHIFRRKNQTPCDLACPGTERDFPTQQLSPGFFIRYVEMTRLIAGVKADNPFYADLEHLKLRSHATGIDHSGLKYLYQVTRRLQIIASEAPVRRELQGCPGFRLNHTETVHQLNKFTRWKIS
jgi:hypothetical protein